MGIYEAANAENAVREERKEKVMFVKVGSVRNCRASEYCRPSEFAMWYSQEATGTQSAFTR